MSKILDVIVPESKPVGALLVGLVTGLIISAFIAVAYRLPQDSAVIYGMAVFCAVPFLIGIITPIFIGYRREITIRQSIGNSLLALLITGFFLLFFALEGIICIIMASPIVAGFTLLGSLLGYAIWKAVPHKQTNVFSSFLVFLLLIPSLSIAESVVGKEQKLTPVTTSIEINAPPEAVWKNVIEFPELAPPTELIFKTGIAYPIKSRIEGTGKGAIRYCEFSTGSFVEPIEIWDENELLEFSVEEQPLPMKETSPYGEIDTPHLHDYFVSRRGQFKLTPLANGNTLLEGTTWYNHRISPEIYWQFWTENIVHAIHQRVLNHIKEQSETKSL